ncbi:hypothetical protein Ancab_037896 [Ancistrocladus abbreviatus]
MKDCSKDSESLLFNHNKTDIKSTKSLNKPITKLALSLLTLLSLSYISCYLKFFHFSSPLPSLSSSSPTWFYQFPSTNIKTSNPNNQTDPSETSLQHIVFGIGSAAKHWERRKEYIKFWWKANETRGFVWLDKPVRIPEGEEPNYPVVKISGDTSRFNYTNEKGTRAGLRITRLVSEMSRMGLANVRWFVMGDDDTVFITDNLVRVLRKYDHTQMYYIGSNSETHVQNIEFSYNMAYGGGGFAISYPLAKALERMLDRCMQRYPELYGSDDRISACLTELGVPLTKEPGFHQFDLYGNLFGILSAHPLAPLVTLHHLDVVDPIFPKVQQTEAIRRLKVPIKVDSAAVMQQSICYDTSRNWTISISWGFSAQIYGDIIYPKEMQKPIRTFVDWYRKDNPVGFTFNTRPVTQHPCRMPYVYYMSNLVFNPITNTTGSEYVRFGVPHPWCWWKMANPMEIDRVQVFKKPNPHLWDGAPRRNCCRVLPTKKQRTVVVDVGVCKEGEVIEAV